MEFTAEQIANVLNGSIEGDKNIKVNKISKIDEASEGSLTFLANEAYTPYIYNTKASLILVNKDFKAENPINCTLIRVDNAYNALAKLLEFYKESQPQKKGISELAHIANTANYGENVYIGEFAYIGENVKIGSNVKIYPQVFIDHNANIGNNTILYPGVKIYEHCSIGLNCVIHSGVVIGADGFGFAMQTDSNYKKIEQIGNVIIEDNVEIGSNTTIDRATMGSTIIKKGVKLDNLIQIGHNAVINENTVMAAQVGIAGSTKIGKSCMLGGQVGISGHLQIGDNVKMAAQAGVGSNIKSGDIIMGSPAIEAGKYKKSYIHFRNLEKLVSRIEELEKEIKNLKNKQETQNS